MNRPPISWLLLFVSCGPAQGSATIIDLGPVEGNWSSGYSVNNRGVLVGASTWGGTNFDTATIWQNGVGSSLTEWPVVRSVALTINDSNQIGGEYVTNAEHRPCIWHDGTISLLEGQGVVVAINNDGVATGTSDDQAVVWVDGKRTFLGSLGGTYSGSSAINDAGMIVGEASNGIVGEAFLWQRGKMIALGNLGGRSVATGISNSGLIVGASQNKYGYWEAFTHDGNRLVGAGTFGYDSSAFWSVNSRDQIIGFVWTGRWSFPERSFIYDHGKLMFFDELLPSNNGWSQLRPCDINDVGQITGFGIYNGQPRAFLMTISQLGDVTGDGFVNVLDLLSVIDAWGSCPMQPAPCSADTNDDGEVNVADLLMVINNWG